MSGHRHCSHSWNIVAPQNATITSQLYWLFDIEFNDSGRFTQNAELQTYSGQLAFVARTILTQIGIEYVEADDQNLLSVLLERFGGVLEEKKV